MDKLFRNIKLLRSFECAARHHSYSQAAAELYVSQAAVSQQMRQLEAALGSALFLRQGRQMKLTPAGESLFIAVQKAFGILQKSVSDIQGQGVASLTITSTQAFTALWLMPRLHAFSERHPEIKVRVSASPHFEDLKGQQIDLAIRFGGQLSVPAGSGLACEYFGEDPVYPVCSAKLAAEKRFEKPADLLDTWLVSLEKPGCFDWPSWFEAAGVSGFEEHRQWTYVNSTDMALNAVANGHGFTLAARYLCAEPLAAGQLAMPVKFPHPAKVRRYLVFDPQSPKLEQLKVFMDWLKAQLPSQP
ncbi:LysR substrate-binding domain-containing protein [Gallaecimonas kandeliae]|uniref:LysR substrate-binding domain-containing protein n=1 Tax=Gallaecimonas kandeliae TaxID=3029055 RepID=UPI002648741F|nr:LysR substrate-binding domain-containing protein [Gallaecimonas kandeliae]WKE66671.1 LysR substrate-binding domain-containing protein [Gallaecimonas kandeliae]